MFTHEIAIRAVFFRSTGVIRNGQVIPAMLALQLFTEYWHGSYSLGSPSNIDFWFLIQIVSSRSLLLCMIIAKLSDPHAIYLEQPTMGLLILSGLIVIEIFLKIIDFDLSLEYDVMRKPLPKFIWKERASAVLTLFHATILYVCCSVVNKILVFSFTSCLVASWGGGVGCRQWLLVIALQ